MKQRLVVIGGGAAGFFCAVNAARLHPSLEVILLERSGKILSKVKVSGGGRCNVTHALFDIMEMSKRYPRGQNFVKKTFHNFFTTDTISWFEERGVPLKTEKDGRMFPVTNSSESIIECLLKEADRYGVAVRMNTEAKDLQRANDVWRVTLNSGNIIEAEFICIASGGAPKATQLEWLQALGHTITEPVPSLFTFNLPKHPITSLMGVVVDKARVKIEGSKLVEVGPVLITHWGLSGPAILRLSAWGARELAQKSYDFKVHINWCPDYSDQTLKSKFVQLRAASASKKISNLNFVNIPNRLWQFLLLTADIKEEVRFADLSSKAENTLIKNLVDFVVEIKGKTTFKEEFVTAGGINLSEIDAATMMSKKAPNIFFAGEIMDVDGITGGFNFQHAWTSGWIAATTISGASSRK